MKNILNRDNSLTPIYARDLNPDILNDDFFGKGFETLLEKEESLMGAEIIVGYLVDKPYLERNLIQEKEWSDIRRKNEAKTRYI